MTSSGAPRVAITVKQADLAEGVCSSSETTGWVAWLRRRLVGQIGLDLLDQLGEGGIGVLAAPPLQPVNQRRVARGGHRRDPRQAARVNAEAEHVDRRLEELAGRRPSQRSDAARLDSIRFQSPSTINAGFGSCASSSRSSDSRSGCITSPS